MQDISVPFTSHRLAESHFLQLFNTQIEFTQLTGQLNFLKTTFREKIETKVAKTMKVKVYTGKPGVWPDAGNASFLSTPVCSGKTL